ncbi:hypothetical protein [Enterococcus sp. AZ126]|uniref:hypothetical protein n=1 Tax=Enterococcus sp. AZ126 TaxID=2774635 RepID=UPI003F234B97
MAKKIWIFLLLTLVIGYSISISGKKGKTENVVITIGESRNFKESEINTAVARVRKEFKDFVHCEMTSLYYDEEKSNREIKNYFKENQEIRNVKNTDKNDFIVLYSDFEVGLENNQNSGFTPGSNYTNWMWLLKKEHFWNSWEIVTFGV